ncbi:MAG TPA: Rieske 2Fe-2S domain-containing protein [Euzebyales bacterium]|nr:Rieske 2Fe-2S domain-containing protein [Euzebyales bacterium]
MTVRPDVRVSAGRVEDVPIDRCVAVADGRAVVVRVGDDVVAFPNRCLHQASALAGGRVLSGRLICPMHFWRYHLPDGEHVGGQGRLVSYDVEVVDGEVFVDVPAPAPPRSMREIMLAHARDWTRDADRPRDGGAS